MPKSLRKITADDILDVESFGAKRKELRAALAPAKRKRRIHVGPDCTFYFESFETMLFQVQEMLYIEKGGDAQLQDELSAYNPLIPNGDELVATMMFEINDPVRRLNLLMKLGGVENHVFLQINGEKIYAIPEDDAERTSADGKTSSVHFFHFPFSEGQKAAFVDPENTVFLGIDHQDYGHMSALSRETICELAFDFS
ncbi:MAG TPA: DUF3501 family protein [Hellea balneolensis]|uniref:DUF3501 family protein n=1 Tax=Hellea balneolensis TaxID=287478 RepID=A0A7C5R785_9PROT|nr:DUF3501 family protein [Hellea balneolensis]